MLSAAADKLDSVTLAPGSAAGLHATLLRSLIPDALSGPGASVAAATIGVNNGKTYGGTAAPSPIPPTPNSVAPVAAAAAVSSSTDALDALAPQPGYDDLAEFATFDGAVDGVPWAGLDDEALAALASIESSIGTFNVRLHVPPPSSFSAALLSSARRARGNC